MVFAFVKDDSCWFISNDSFFVFVEYPLCDLISFDAFFSMVFDILGCVGFVFSKVKLFVKCDDISYLNFLILFGFLTIDFDESCSDPFIYLRECDMWILLAELSHKSIDTLVCTICIYNYFHLLVAV